MIHAQVPAANVTLRRSSGGVFEVTVQGRLRYSKKAEGRFPTDEEIRAVVG
ncbi:MAG: Rdx family protein [Acidisphaera sp.]|nr:Rdx family protein [Acidisphaera sp.]MBV9811649.1 Rdx family protein [Acetobacteraceae bacterium]